MECQKIINLLDNASNQPSKFRTKNRVKRSDESRAAYNTDAQIKFKTTLSKSIYGIIVTHIYLLK